MSSIEQQEQYIYQIVYIIQMNMEQPVCYVQEPVGIVC